MSTLCVREPVGVLEHGTPDIGGLCSRTWPNLAGFSNVLSLFGGGRRSGVPPDQKTENVRQFRQLNSERSHTIRAPNKQPYRSVCGQPRRPTYYVPSSLHSRPSVCIIPNSQKNSSARIGHPAETQKTTQGGPDDLRSCGSDPKYSIRRIVGGP